MTTVEMTRAQVISAIKRERLTARQWVSEDSDAPPTASCGFCAVGSVVRRAMAQSTPAGWIGNVAEHIGWDGSTMQELSSAFEACASIDNGVKAPTVTDETLEAGRAAAIAYVESPAFPDYIEIDIGVARPGRGVRVVSP